MLCRLGYLANIFSKINEVSLSLQGKQLMVFVINNKIWGFPGGAVVENLPANAGDMGSSPGLGRSHMPRSN